MQKPAACDRAQVLSELKRGNEIRNPEGRDRFRLGTMRKAAGLCGLPASLATLVVAAFRSATAAIGKAAKRDDVAKAVIHRLLELHRAREEFHPASYQALISWVQECEPWFAQHQLEAAYRASERKALAPSARPLPAAFARFANLFKKEPQS